LDYLRGELRRLTADVGKHRDELRRALVLQRDHLEARRTRLTDAFLDGALERDDYEQRRTALLEERRRIEEQVEQAASDTDIGSNAEAALELASNAYLLYERATVDDKRDLLELLYSNRCVEDKRPMFSLELPFQLIANRTKLQIGGPLRDTVRTKA